jgi:hypothetical protein
MLGCGVYLNVMSARLRITFGLRLSGVAVLMLALNAVRPCEAWASCGDWLAGHGFERSAAFASGSDADRGFSSARPRLPVVPFEEPGPCRGPACRQAPEAPVPSSPPTLIDSYERWLSLVDEPSALEIGNRRLVLEATCDSFAGLRPRVDRPPRV